MFVPVCTGLSLNGGAAPRSDFVRDLGLYERTGLGVSGGPSPGHLVTPTGAQAAASSSIMPLIYHHFHHNGLM